VQQEISDDLSIHKKSNDGVSYENNFFTDLLSSYPLWVALDSKLESEHLKQKAQQVKIELLISMNTNKTFIALINRIKEYDDVLLIHSINTMCISLMIGLTLELSKSELFDLTVAALFSNVGFVEVEKKDFLSYLKTNEHIHEQLKKHLEIFSEITMDFPELRKKSVVYGILDHHEYYNGKGYPNGKKGEEISLYGRILCIAHNYDELVGGYNYKIGLHPIDALRIIYENIENRYDQNVLNIFMYRTTYFKLGEPISLPNIQNGVIIGFDDFIKAPHLPKIKLENGNIINLANS
jgi:HD-GYP domain-containing protein (c-di-GMP phosphodiesterase class II)